MSKKEQNQLEGPENWDFECAEQLPGISEARAIVSVAFTQDEFEQIDEFAERAGIKLTEFIRKVILERIQGVPVPE